MTHTTSTPYPLIKQTIEFPTRINQPFYMRLGRGLWLFWLILTVIIFSLNALNFFQKASVVCTQETCQFPFALTQELADNLMAVGVSPIVWAGHILFLDILMVTTYIGVATIIYLRRPNDWLVMVTTGMLIGLSANVVISNSVSPFANTGWDWLPNLHTLVTIYTAFKFLAVFPDGQYVPKWMRWWVYIGMTWEVGRRVFAGSLTSNDGSFRLDLFLSTFIIAGVGIVAQIIRYRYHSTPNQRQQTKWAILGGALCLVCVTIGAGVYFTILPIIEAQSNAIWLNIGLRLVYYSAFFLLVMGLGFSIVRYRIWEADLAINRSVVYFFLSTILALLFLGSLVVFQRVFIIILGQEMDILSTIIATGLVVSLSPFIQRRVRHQIDKRIFGFRQDLIQLNKQQQQRVEIYSEGKQGALSGQTIGNYAIGALIGKGGMGQVYHATHTQSKNAVALKVMADALFQENMAQERFEREATLAKTLHHPHIVPVHEAFSDMNHLYLVMPYIEGRDLWQVYKAEGKIPLAHMLPILRQIADALDYLHKQGIVHRDIKPSNIMIGDDDHAWLLDFGIAKWVNDSHILTRTTGILGTLDYTAPEQLISSKNVDHRADIYALGVMTYQLLAGEAPFVGNIGNLVFAHLNQPAPDIRLIAPHIPEKIAYALIRCMAKDADDRYDSAGAFIKALMD
ncbi:MAG: serine/threonine-protein kinase [bacterium]|nr:serine/threonine-protein kinase [bacterium]